MILRRNFLAGLMGTAAAATLGQGVRIDTQTAATPADALANRLAHDPRRPQYHLLPAANWMNDPNGPIYWNGQYHMFYQYNPDGAYWGNMHWGHAVSPDMVHWKHLPVALAPTPGGPDAEGCFTGTAVVQDGRVTILYTGVSAAPLREATIKDAAPPLRETQCLAVAVDTDLQTWRKAPEPVIAVPPAQFEVNGFRDPSPWRQGEWWYTVTASGLANKGGAVLLYRSRDLRNWEFMHILAQRDRAGRAAFDSFDPWEVWECPEFFPLGDWHVLIFSTAGKTYWQTGKLDEKTMLFHAEQAGILDYGSFYAAKTQLDKAGNRIVWGWVPETRPLEEFKAAGWAGLMSLPRTLSVAGDGRLRVRVADAVSQLRGREQSLSFTADEEGNRRQIDALRIAQCCGELYVKARRGAEPFALALAGTAEGAGSWMTIGYHPDHRDQVWIDGRPLSLSLENTDELELHLYVDGSVIELLVNGQIAWTKRFYPTGDRPQDVRLKWNGRTTAIAHLAVWQLTPISPDRLTS